MSVLDPGEQLEAASPCRYLLITPVYNEESFLDDMIRSVVNQTIRPAKWLIVDDGSNDRTPQILAAASAQHPWIEIVRRERDGGRLAGGESALQLAFRKVRISDYDYVGRFDADLAFGRDYMESLFREFRNTPRLGIAGGTLYVPRDGRLEAEIHPEYHVRGAVKMYRRECLEQVGEPKPYIGWDSIDEVYAWIHNWKTQTFPQYHVIHKRPTGAGLSVSRIYSQRGKGEYYSWSHPLFVFLKAIKIGIQHLSVVKPVSMLVGFISCYRRREPRLQDPEFKRTWRRQQLGRMFKVGRIPSEQ